MVAPGGFSALGGFTALGLVGLGTGGGTGCGRNLEWYRGGQQLSLLASHKKGSGPDSLKVC